MKSTQMKTPATGLSCYVAGMPAASIHSAFTAPNAAAQGTGLSFAGTVVAGAAAEVAAPSSTAGVRNIDLPGSPPRGAPV